MGALGGRWAMGGAGLLAATAGNAEEQRSGCVRPWIQLITPQQLTGVRRAKRALVQSLAIGQQVRRYHKIQLGF